MRLSAVGCWLLAVMRVGQYVGGAARGDYIMVEFSGLFVEKPTIVSEQACHGHCPGRRW